MGADNLMSAMSLSIILLFVTIVFIVVCWFLPQIASALTGGGAIQGSMRTIYNVARKGLSKADSGVRVAMKPVQGRLGRKGGGNIKKS